MRVQSMRCARKCMCVAGVSEVTEVQSVILPSCLKYTWTGEEKNINMHLF